MRSNGLPRAAAALAALAVLAAVMFTVVVALLVEVGLARWAASPTAVGATVAATLALADTHTPLGNRTVGLRELPREKLGVDVALTALVGGVVAFAGAYALLQGDSGDGLARLVVLSAAVVAGYVTFVARNLAVYRGETR
jgi:hypothetical protein